MRLLQRFAQESCGARIEAFSDGVFAIVWSSSSSVHAAFLAYLLTPLFFIVPPTRRGAA